MSELTFDNGNVDFRTEADSEGAMTFQSQPQPQFNWNPKEDITAYELSLCLPFLFGDHYGIATISSLPDNAQRHFQRVRYRRMANEG